MKLLLKIKNGTPPMRKAALRQITDKAREMGAGALFNQILPLLMSPTLEDQERHLLVKVVLKTTLHSLNVIIRPLPRSLRNSMVRVTDFVVWACPSNTADQVV